MGILESLPVQRVRPVLLLPLWTGSLRDVSGYGNHATESGDAYWASQGRTDCMAWSASGALTVADDPSLRALDWTWFIGGRDWQRYTGTDRLISKRDATGTQFDIRKGTATLLSIYDGVASRTRNWSPTIGLQTFTVTLTNGAAAHLYTDGASVGAFSGVGTYTGHASDIMIGNYYTAANPSASPFDCVIGYPAILTPTEIASLHTWAIAKFTPRKQWPGGGVTVPSGVVSPEFADNIQAARVTLANVTSGWLSNTGWHVNSGTWAVTEDATGRWITCVAAGQIEHQLTGASGFTTALFGQEGGATLTKNAQNIQIDAAAGGERIWAVQLVA